MTDQPLINLQKLSLQKSAGGEVRCLAVQLISSVNVSSKKTSVVPFVHAWRICVMCKLLYMPGIFEGDLSLQCRAKMNSY